MYWISPPIFQKRLNKYKEQPSDSSFADDKTRRQTGVRRVLRQSARCGHLGERCRSQRSGHDGGESNGRNETEKLAFLTSRLVVVKLLLVLR